MHRSCILITVILCVRELEDPSFLDHQNVGKKEILEIISIDRYQKASPWIFDQVNYCLLKEDITTACILLTKLQLTF